MADLQSFNAYGLTYGETEWDEYYRYRARYPQGVFDDIFEFHEQHGGQLKLALDVGSGNGFNLAPLLARFDHVTAVDIGAEALAAGRQRFASAVESGQLVSQQQKAEEYIETLEPGSVDMIFAAATVHWLDRTRWIKASARALKKGGTLAFVMGGGGASVMADQQLDAMLTKAYAQMPKYLPQWPARTDAAMAVSASKLRSVDLDAIVNELKDETRISYQTPFKSNVAQAQYDNLGVEPWKDESKGQFIEKPSEVKESWTAEEFAIHVRTMVPVPQLVEKLLIDPLWIEATTAIKDKLGDRVDYTYALSLCMASKQ